MMENKCTKIEEEKKKEEEERKVVWVSETE